MIGGVSLETKEMEGVVWNFALEVQREILTPFLRKKHRVIVLAGPTSCGKSHLAIKLAQGIGGEVVSADSMQVYCGMDIGTAKVSREERLLVPHHLVDIRSIQENFNVVDFCREARRACREIVDRGGVPIVAGGTGFYLHALIYGAPEGPPSVPALRKAFEEECRELGAECLYDRLMRLDSEYARSLTRHDRQKIIRALEIIELTHQKVSDLSWSKTPQPQDYDFRCWFLHRPREVLYKRIEARCDTMLEEGFLEEVACLEQQGLRNNSSASQAIGYRQALDFLTTRREEADYVAFVKAFKQATRRYAKRQFTWFRKEPLFRWLDVDMHDPEVVFDIIRQDYEVSSSM